MAAVDLEFRIRLGILLGYLNFFCGTEAQNLQKKYFGGRQYSRLLKFWRHIFLFPRATNYRDGKTLKKIQFSTAKEGMPIFLWAVSKTYRNFTFFCGYK